MVRRGEPSPELSLPWRFRDLRAAASGATSQVFRATDSESGQPVALKVAQSPEHAALLADEAELLLTVQSPYLPSVVALGRVPAGAAPLAESSAFLALEWVRGEPLDPKGLRDSDRERVAHAVARDAGRALSHLHDAGVGHGDVKPANLLLERRGRHGPTRVRLVDLGFSVPIAPGELRGATPRYLSPEAASGLGSARSRDLWALGVVLAEVLSPGVAEARDPAEALRGARLPQPFRAWCDALTAPEPSARPSAGWLAAAAEQAAERAGAPSKSPAHGAERAVHACYARVRRPDIARAARARELEVRGEVCPWLSPLVKVARQAAALRGEAATDGGRVVLEPLGPTERLRWLVLLAGSSAASWRLAGPVAAASEARLASALERLARRHSPRIWTLRDVLGALESAGECETSPREPSVPLDEVDVALGLARRPAAEQVLREAERRLGAGELGERHVLPLAEALRSAGELGRALASLGAREDRSSAALRAELLRRMGRAEQAAAAARPLARGQGPAAARARAVVARVLLDGGQAREALAELGEDGGGDSIEVRALALLAVGEGEAARAEIERGMALASDEETLARLGCVLGMDAHARGDAEAAHGAFSRAVDHAVRAGALVEEATYRTGMAAAAVDAGFVGEALEASLRAALLWEHLGRPRQWAYALLSRAAAFALVGAAHDARETAAQAMRLGAEARDGRAEAFAAMVLADASELGSQSGREAAARAWAALGDSALDDDRVRAAARMLVHGADGVEARVEPMEAAASAPGVSGTAQCEWWWARAVAARRGGPGVRDADLVAHVSRCVRAPAPVGSKGPAVHEARLAAERAGDGEAARMLAGVQAAMASVLVSHTPAHLRECLGAVAWVARLGPRLEAAPSGEQVRDIETLVKALARRDNLRALLVQALDALVLWTGVERGLLLLRAPDDRLVVRAARNLGREDLGREQIALSQSLAHRALASREPVVAVDAAGEISEVHRSVHALGLRSVLAVPLVARGEALGVAYLDDRVRTGAFGPRELAWVRLVAMVAAVAIADARDQLLLRRAARRARRAQGRLAEALAARETALALATEELGRARGGRQSRYRYDAIVGHSEPVRAMLRLVDRITPTDVPVLVAGESGSGKELVARALHANGPRRDGPFVSENCGAIPEPLLESTLFGHVRGAFTGADRSRPGLFEMADRGTLFLDEIAEMSLGMQTKLLRTLQDGEVHPLGSTRTRKVDVRVIAATNKDLAALVQHGRFREDLYYRLDVIAIRVPPLRDRRDDIPLLVRHFVERHAAGRTVRVSREAQARLEAYDWPGNVRQLENEVRRALVLCDETVRIEHLSPQLVASPAPAAAGAGDLDVRARVDALETQLVLEALGRTRGNQTRAAKLLGLSRFGLQKMMKRLAVSR